MKSKISCVGRLPSVWPRATPPRNKQNPPSITSQVLNSHTKQTGRWSSAPAILPQNAVTVRRTSVEFERKDPPPLLPPPFVLAANNRTSSIGSTRCHSSTFSSPPHRTSPSFPSLPSRRTRQTQAQPPFRARFARRSGGGVGVPGPTLATLGLGDASGHHLRSASVVVGSVARRRALSSWVESVETGQRFEHSVRIRLKHHGFSEILL